jgi:hypothetical protein
VTSCICGKMKVMYMHKGVPILHSALIGSLRLELAYRESSTLEPTDELRRGNQEWAKSDLSQSLLPDRTHGKDNGDNAIEIECRTLMFDPRGPSTPA